MEYVDGHDLISHMKANGLPGIAESIDYVSQAASGLAHAHGHQVFHRNVKPSNLMLDRQGVVKVVGMGLALLGDDADIGEFDQITQAGEQLGSADFMAPEQTNDSHEIDQRADIYSLGCTLYFLLTGKIPYPGKGAMEKFLAHRSAPIPSIRERRPDVPEHVDELFKKMVAKHPQDRFQTMQEVLAALQPAPPPPLALPVALPLAPPPPPPAPTLVELNPQESLDGFLRAVAPGTVRQSATPVTTRRAGAGQVTVPILWIALGAGVLVIGLAIALLAR
jgi:serine/threonine protein kinase